MVGMGEAAMAKKANRGGKREGAGRPNSGRDDVSAKIDKTVVARARFVADLRGITLAEYLTETLRPVVDRDFDRASRKSGADEDSPPHPRN